MLCFDHPLCSGIANDTIRCHMYELSKQLASKETGTTRDQAIDLSVPCYLITVFDCCRISCDNVCTSKIGYLYPQQR